MSIKEKLLTFLLLFGTWATEAQSFMQHFWPKTLDITYSLWLQPSFIFQLSVVWYIKMLSENLLMLISFFLLTQFRNGFSKRMFYIAVINVCYHTFDFISFLWNYKETYLAYWILLLVITIWQLFIIFGKRQAKIVQL